MNNSHPTAPISPGTILSAPPTAGAPVYGFTPYPGENFQNQPPPSYSQAMGVPPASPFTPQEPSLRQQQIITTVVRLGIYPTHMICPNCRKEMETKIHKTPKVQAYLAGLLICLVGCFCGCCLIPCCFNECMQTQHYCSLCNAYVGSSSPI